MSFAYSSALSFTFTHLAFTFCFFLAAFFAFAIIFSHPF
jgi:hypothetical protein